MRRAHCKRSPRVNSATTATSEASEACEAEQREGAWCGHRRAERDVVLAERVTGSLDAGIGVDEEAVDAGFEADFTAKSAAAPESMGAAMLVPLSSRVVFPPQG